jgi:hypothetical protein
MEYRSVRDDHIRVDVCTYLSIYTCGVGMMYAWMGDVISACLHFRNIIQCAIHIQRIHS